VDLDGNPGELLTEEHIEHAKQALKESKERVFASRRTNTKEKDEKAKKPRRPAVRKTEKADVAAKPKAAVKAPAAEAPLVKVDAATLKVGQDVRVVMGKFPVPATIKEVTKDDVQVQLQTGMMVRVKSEHLVL
ncbi:MAG: RNA chaperone ProQ, partial [Aeromonas veronii]